MSFALPFSNGSDRKRFAKVSVCLTDKKKENEFQTEMLLTLLRQVGENVRRKILANKSNEEVFQKSVMAEIL